MKCHTPPICNCLFDVCTACPDHRVPLRFVLVISPDITSVRGQCLMCSTYHETVMAQSDKSHATLWESNFMQ